MDPVIDAFTISVSPACREKKLIINSVAFPKVAFSNPPSAGPVCAEISSVDSPINFASGMIAREAKTNIAMGEECVYSANRLSGTKMRKILKMFSRIFVFFILTNLLCHLAKSYHKATSNKPFSFYVLMTRLKDIFIPQARQEGNLRNQKKKERKEK